MAPEITTARPRWGTDLPVKGGLSVSKGGGSLEDLRRLPPLLTAPQAFLVVGVSTSTGYEWIKRGVIPVVHLGARMYVQTAQLAEAVFGIAPALLLEEEHRPAPARVDELTKAVGLMADGEREGKTKMYKDMTSEGVL